MKGTIEGLFEQIIEHASWQKGKNCCIEIPIESCRSIYQKIKKGPEALFNL